MIKIRKIKVEPTKVYDISVPETKCFFANDILVHNCEIALPTKPLKHIFDGASKRKIRVPKEKYQEFLEFKKQLKGTLHLNRERFNGVKSTN